jgi:trigger factor
LNITQTHQENHQLELVVETEQESFQKAKHRAAKELSKDHKIPGYRPGKAPYQLIVNQLGESRIIDHALEYYLDEIYPKILDEIEQEPYGPGQLQEIESLEPPVFKFVIPLQPVVELGNYQDIRISYEEGQVEEEDVQEVINRIAAQQAVIEEVDHPAEEANIVDTTLSGRLADADPDDEDAQVMINQPLPVMVKTQDEDDSKEWPFPGFSRQLLGVSEGEELELTHEHPDSENVDEEIRGKEVLYTVKVEGVRERVLPDIDDEFVQSISEAETVAELEEEIRADLIAQNNQEVENEYLNQIFDRILEDSEVKYPPQMVDKEVEGELQELSQRLQAQGMELEMYLEMQEMSVDDLQEQIRPQAEVRIERGLIVGEIADSEDFNIQPEEITGEYHQILDQHFGEGDSEERKQFLSSPDSMQLLNRISSQMISQKVVSYLIALAKGEDTSEFFQQEEEIEAEAEAEPASEEPDRAEVEAAPEGPDQEEPEQEEPEQEQSDQEDQEEPAETPTAEAQEEQED